MTINLEFNKAVRFFKCKVCGEGVEILTRIHMTKHNLTLEEYCLMFPEHCEVRFWGCITSVQSTKKFKKLKQDALKFERKKLEVLKNENSKGVCST